LYNQPTNFINNSLNSTDFFWDFGDGSSSNIENPAHSYVLPGNYLISLLSSNQCSQDKTTSSIHISGSLAKVSASLCEGDSVFLDGLYRYLSGNYKDVFQTSSGCDSIILTNLVINPTYNASLTPSICEGETFIVGSKIYSTSGVYTDLLKTYLNCDSLVNINLTVNPLPAPSLGIDTLMCPGDLIVLSPGNNYSSYLWSDGSNQSELRVNLPGNYSVKVFDGFCEASDTIFIDDCGTELWFPNAFTPNNDGINDQFRPVSQGVLITYQLLIFNRWGQQLYESNDAYKGWNGTFNGNQCPEGVYYFKSEYSLGANPTTRKQEAQRGSVTLLR
jgi:gliding motility-associated-like protein